MKSRNVFGLLGLLTAVGVVALAAPPAAVQEAPANTWVKLEDSASGARRQPMFLYAPNIKRFVLASGQQGRGYGKVERHYDTEEFDLASLKWFNAYPAELAKGRPESGPVSEEYAKMHETFGHSGKKGPYLMDGEFLRPTAGGQWAGQASQSFAWCYNSDDGLIYMSPDKWMFTYNPKDRTWKLLDTPPREFSLAWGSMCYDPVNKEIVYTGGGSGSAENATWIYSPANNAWSRREFGTAEFKALRAKAVTLVWAAKNVAGRSANRFAVTETAEEAKVNLASSATALVSQIEAFVKEVTAAKLTGSEARSAAAATLRLTSAAEAAKAVGSTLTAEITPQKIEALRGVREWLEKVQDALSSEPPSRARSQMAYDPTSQQIWLFGGDGLDRVLSDTWVYDCKTRAWEQRFVSSPSPRAGHLLVYAPKSKRIFVVGGYSRTKMLQDIWTFDTASGAWKLVGQTGSNDAAPQPQLILVGAVDEDDVVVALQNDGPDKRQLWACRLDPAKPALLTDVEPQIAKTPGEYTWQSISPATWEQEAASVRDLAKSRKFLTDLPANQWTAFEFPKYAPGARNRWGTSAYDTDRHQFMLWGGGHATSHENDVGHFSVLGSFWTLGFHPDAPIEPTYASQPTELSFRDRAHVPMHAYKSYAYDPASKKMFYLQFAYDLQAREWESAPSTGLEHRGCMNTHLRSTPKGVVAVSTRGFFRYDPASHSWNKLPLGGEKISDRIAWCDGPAMIYDGKRDCFWMFYTNEIYKYDFASGNVSKVEFTKPAALEKGYIFPYGEAVYMPDSDLILSRNPVPRPDGSYSPYVFNPNDSKFYWAPMPFIEKGKTQEFKRIPFNHSDAIAYDPTLKLALINNSSAYRVWVLKFDHTALKLQEMAAAEERKD